MRNMLLTGAAALAVIAGGHAAFAQPNQCFFINQWQNWKAPNDHTILLSVTGHGIYRLDLVGSCPELTWPGARLISRNTAGSICTPLDFDLKVSLQGGPATPCLVRHMTLLSPQEAASLPRGVRP